MTTFLTILACFAGVFAFALGISGLVGLMSWESPDKRGGFLDLLDHTFTAGIFTALGDISCNWKDRPTERRFVYAALACGLTCITLVITIRRMSLT